MPDKEASVDALVPDTQVVKEFGITSMTLWRWSHDATLNFPVAMKIRNRSFRSRNQLEDFKQHMLRKAIVERSRKGTKAV